MIRGAAVGGERGSTLPLLLGYVVLALALLVVCVCATDLHLAQKRLDAVADAAALAGADGFTVASVDGVAILRLSDAAVREQAAAVLAAEERGRAELVSAGTPDGTSARVTVRAAWTPPLLADAMPPLVELRSTATSRTVLR
ncbi:pilus assembly protein TadG-related protein [Microbacterium resistens]|uniref:pilus assembly protein TadG-related protein n=1 Tax=Microbacterium resistens TaxID=156977 RepID=UPI00082FF608|nr:pilus assembly protein TadG-related protein [Microbacterium resistens]